MSEQAFSPMVVPGTFIRVRAEGLISVGGISTGNIGIVGTAAKGVGSTELLSSYAEAIEKFGRYDKASSGNFNLVRGLELLYANGARTVYARAVADSQADFTAAMNEVIKEDVNIIVIPELNAGEATGTMSILGGIVSTAENQSKDLLAVVGSEQDTVAGVVGQVAKNKRVVMVAPGIKVAETTEVDENGDPVAPDADLDDDAKAKVTTKTVGVTLKGNYTAACVAGLLSSLAPHVSPTNKVLAAIPDLDQRYSYGELESLLKGGVMPLERRGGTRAVRGITTDEGGAFAQITTRRIVDQAKAGVRKVGEAFVGRLNNERVRAALKGAVQGFLDRMINDEALIGYSLDVSATRAEQVAGIARVDMLLQPTFSIDYLAVTIVLE
jgi:hypothetical protein